MSIYNVSGNELSACYALDGTPLQKAYNINGVEIFSAESGYSENNMVSYFRAPTKAVCEEVNALSSDWETIIHITDTHGNANRQHSQAIGMYVLDHTPAKFIVLGGDYIAGFDISANETEYRTYMTPFLNSGMMSKIFAIMGNHEVGQAGIENGHYDAISEILYNDFVAGKTGLHGDLENNNYYLDDAEKKIRYVFLNTSDHAAIGVTSDQLSWLDQTVVLPDSTWALWCIGHVRISNMGGEVFSGGRTAVKDRLLNCNGSVIGYLCGHEHCDYLYHNGTFEEITMQGDLFSNTDYYPGISVTDRVSGTVTEQAVSVISFNTKTRQVVIRRIGAGRQSSYSYSY